MSFTQLHSFAITTRLFRANESLVDFVSESLAPQAPRDGDVIAITSKIVSLAEGRLRAREGVDKTELVKSESDVFLGEIGYGCSLTIKEGLLIPSAGIDESNSEDGHYILYPQNPQASAERLRLELRTRFGLRKLGVILTDSHTTPLRQGVSGVGLAYAGFRAVRDMIGEPDLFGRELKMTKMNLLDGLSAVAVMLMGEASECRPLAILRGADLDFVEQVDTAELKMPMDSDLYGPLYRHLLDSAISAG